MITLTLLSTTTPAGTLTTLLRPAGADDTVVAAGFTTVEVLLDRLSAPDATVLEGDPQRAVGVAIDSWLDGDIGAMDSALMEQTGTDFQHQVWQALAKVPPGQTATYGELASMVGRASATRAVGSACGRNLIAPWIPCHRALRADGSLGGYAWGLDVKRWLLAHEAAGIS